MFLKKGKHMQKENVKTRMVGLVDLIIMHDKLYEENRPIITDSEYDALYYALMELEERCPDLVLPHSPTKNIYTKTVDALIKAKHSTPMLSQDKATTLVRIEEWKKQSPLSDIVIQHKMDGLTLVLTYEDGQLKRAVTRGNGEIGEDVTHNAMVISNIPKLIHYRDVLEVRGEVIVPFNEFERINVDGRYSNPRNLASGTIRQLSAEKSAKIKMQFHAFDIANKYSIPSLKTELAVCDFLKDLCFTVAKTWLVHRIDTKGISQVLESIEKERRTLPYMIDGAVLKFNDFEAQENLGSTSKFPKWAIAYKFHSLDATTELSSVVWQVGKSGQITPVANFKQVDIDGVSITRATLHNYQNIKTKDIRIGDTIVVARANDVIPHIQQSIKDVRTGKELEIEKPMFCPACGEPLVEMNRSGESPLLRCMGTKCEPQLVGKITHWASRDALNLMSVGEQVIRDLFDNGIVKSIGDLYTKVEAQKDFISMQMPGYGETKVANMIEAITNSKSAELSRVLYGLSIDNIGLSTAKDIAKEFLSMDVILDLLESDVQTFVRRLQSINGVADSVTEAFLNYMGCWVNGQAQNLTTENDNVLMLKGLRRIGLTMIEPTTVVGDTLKGKTFVITGALSRPRNEIQKEIENLGGKVVGSVSKKTDYLLMGDGEENSSKHQKAKELKINIIDEQTFIIMIK